MADGANNDPRAWPRPPALGGESQGEAAPETAEPLWRLWGGLGVLFGALASPLWCGGGFAALPRQGSLGPLRSAVITWNLGGYVAVSVLLWRMRRERRLANFATAALVTHVLVGGIINAMIIVAEIVLG